MIRTPGDLENRQFPSWLLERTHGSSIRTSEDVLLNSDAVLMFTYAKFYEAQTRNGVIHA